MDRAPGQKILAVAERWPLVEVRLYLRLVKNVVIICRFRYTLYYKYFRTVNERSWESPIEVFGEGLSKEFYISFLASAI